MLFCTALEGTCTGEDMLIKLDNKLWDDCIGVYTDSAGAMLGEKGLKQESYKWHLT